MSDKTVLIEIKNMCKEFNNDEVVTKVLQNIDFTIKQGEFVAIMGPSGSGKSTLMHILGFLDKPTCGNYYFKGQEVSKFDDNELAKLRNQEAGFVFQQFNLLPRTSVYENVKLPLTYSANIDKQEKNNRVMKAIESVGLGHRKNNLSNQLSGGEKQRVAIARSLVTKPAMIFADEPTGNLDSKSGEQVMKILSDLNEKEGKTIILVTHEQYTAEYAERIIKIKDGTVQSDTKVLERKKDGLKK